MDIVVTLIIFAVLWIALAMLKVSLWYLLAVIGIVAIVTWAVREARK